jgi:L-ascorbate metabolism protein UlaG (beta-lactamase superfamily)
MASRAVRAAALLLTLAGLTAPSGGAAQRPSITARFIGNMAVALSDGAVTVMTDFPYESGYSVYMEYPPDAIRSTTPITLSLITHGHSDHWKRELFVTTGWNLAGPADIVSTVPAARVVPLTGVTTFHGIDIAPIETPHAGIGHYSYVLTWHGRRLYFSGDTESIDHLVALKNLSVAFVSPWLHRSVLKAGRRIDADRVVIYHHQDGERVPECAANCLIPQQGQSIRLD